MNTSDKISKVIRSLLKIEFKKIIYRIQNKKINASEIKGELFSSESNSLLFQMYIHEEEDLFV